MVGCSLEAERTHRHLLEPAPGQGPLRVENVLQGAIDIGSHVEVEVAVAVRIEEGGTRVPAGRLDPGVSGHVLEPAVAEVAIEHVAAEVGDEEIGPAVPVVVGHGHARAPLPLAAHPRLVRHVLEGPVGEAAIEGVLAPLGHPCSLQAPAVDQVHVETPVAVVVEKGHPCPGRVEEVVLVGPAAQQHPREPGLCRDVHEAESRRGGSLRRRGTKPGPKRAQGDDEGRGESDPAHLPGLSSSETTVSTFFHSASRASALGARAI